MATEHQYPLHQLIIEKDITGVFKLIKQGNIDIDQLNAQQWSSLHLCAQKDLLKVAKYLVAAKANIENKNSKGVTPLHSAVWADARKMTNYLLSNGANPNAKDNAGWEPLSLASWNNNIELIKELIKFGAEVNTRFKDGSTPLHYAVWNNSIAAIEELIEQGAKIDAKNKDGLSVIDLANKLGLTDVLDLLESMKNVKSKFKLRHDELEISNLEINEVPEVDEENYIMIDEATIPTENIRYETEINQAEETPVTPRLVITPQASSQRKETKISSINTEQPENDNMDFRYDLDAKNYRHSSDGSEYIMKQQNQLINYTLSGEKVRRKSEVIIANLLYSLDIDFIYERKICGTVKRGVLFPCFTIFANDNDLIIWEHLSKTPTQDNSKLALEVVEWYKANGFIEGKNLYISSDNPDGGIDSRQLIEIAENIINSIEAEEDVEVEEELPQKQQRA